MALVGVFLQRHFYKDIMANLITLDDYKLYAGINNPAADDKLESLITQCSTLIKSYCSQSFIDYVDEVYTEYFDTGCSKYILSEGPVLSLSSVAYSTDYGLTYTDYDLDKREAILNARYDMLVIPSYITDVYDNGIRVEYYAGYETLPEDLKLVTMDLISYYHKDQSTPRKGTGSVTLEYVTSSDFPAHIKRVLDLYRKL